MTAVDWLALAAALVFIVVLCRWLLHVMNTPRTTPKVPRVRRTGGRWRVGIDVGPFWFLR